MPYLQFWTLAGKSAGAAMVNVIVNDMDLRSSDMSV